MHVLMIPSWYPLETDPVRGCFFREQGEALARAGHRVSVFPYHSDAEKNIYTERCQWAENMTEYYIHYKPLPGHLTGLRLVTEMAAMLLSWPKGDRPDVIHVHVFKALKYALYLRKLFGIPVVVTEHASWFERGLLSDKTKQSIARLYQKADAVLAVSDGLADQIRPLCSGRVQVIPNMVRPEYLEGELRAPAGESFRWIAVGSLNRNKGMDLVLSAFAAAASQRCELRLTICGDGPERQALEQQAAELKIVDRVEFTGFLPREECRRLLLQSQAFILASRVETFGISAAEAMGCGLPVVMTRTNAWRELITPETGLSAAVGDTDGLRDAILSVTEHYAQYDPEKIRAFCAGSFSPERVCEQLTAVYRSVCPDMQDTRDHQNEKSEEKEDVRDTEEKKP